MIDNKKIVRTYSWQREDYKEYIYYVPKQSDVLKVRDFIKKLRTKYWDRYDSYEADKWVKQFILRTLNWVCMNDFWRVFNINKLN